MENIPENTMRERIGALTPPKTLSQKIFRIQIINEQRQKDYNYAQRHDLYSRFFLASSIIFAAGVSYGITHMNQVVSVYERVLAWLK